MGKLSKDAKDLLIGKDGSENEPRDFKTELEESIKLGIVSKAEGALLVTARLNSDKLGEKINNYQLDATKKVKDNKVYENSEEEKKAIKDKQEKERKRKQREEQIAQKMSEMAKNKPVQGIEHKLEDEDEHTRERGK